jgi:hypothetical protein
MALEYLTANSLTRYPFKDAAVAGIGENDQLPNDWFYDILFVSKTPTLRSVYISNISKSSNGTLSITFNNCETLEALEIAVIPAEDVMEHLGNTATSFAAVSTNTYCVKFVLGIGLVNLANNTNHTYVSTQTTLASPAFVLYSPKLKSVDFSNYVENLDVSGKLVRGKESVHKFYYNSPQDFTAVPTIRPQANTFLRSQSSEILELYVLPGKGTGLFDPCRNVNNSLYTINNIAPTDSGALFLSLSGCYAANLLTQNEADYFNFLTPSLNPLTPYKSFSAHSSDGSVRLFNASTPNNSLLLENFCKPRCAPENLTAFAHYLNRVSDGVNELNSIASRNTETRGKGGSIGNVFTVDGFCLDGNPFERCASSADTEAVIACGHGFIKNYHEGKTLQLYYSSTAIRSYTIVEVRSDTSVLLDAAPTATGAGVFFRVDDNGVISNMNCAVSSYNLKSENFLKPYFTVKYTTSEAYNSSGQYVTFLAIAVAVFNPSKSTVAAEVRFHGTNFTRQGVFKIRKAGSIEVSSTPTTTLGCNSYAFIEAIYFLPCGTSGDGFTVDVYETGTTAKIGPTQMLAGINGVSCPSALGSSKVIRVFQGVQFPGQGNSDFLQLPTGTTKYTLVGEAPSWLVTTYKSNNYTLDLSTTVPGETSNRRYSLYYRCDDGAIPGAIVQLIVDYVARPTIVAPLGGIYTTDNPIVISKSEAYSTANPLFQVSATNMTKLSSDFPTDQFRYSVTSSLGLPNGLFFDENTGKMTGQLDPAEPAGKVYSLQISAVNPAGSSNATQTIYLTARQTSIPSVSISPSAILSADNVTNYTEQSPLFSINSSAVPTYLYSLLGNLPAGLSFSPVTGKVTGKATQSSAGVYNLTASASNAAGESLGAVVQINYTTKNVPGILTPAADSTQYVSFDSLSTLNSPLFLVTASTPSGLSVSYSGANIPLGYLLDSTTGAFYGQLHSSLIPTDPLITFKQYTVRLYATNAAGSVYVDVLIYFTRSNAPTINNLVSGGEKSITRNQTYSASAPALAVSATNSPTSYTFNGTLPAGLSFNTSSGIVSGTVTTAALAGTYPITLSASNSYGTSSIVPYNIFVPVCITQPVNNFSFSYTVGSTISIPLRGATESGEIKSGENVTYSISGLPVGLSISGTFPTQSIAGTVLQAGTSIVTISAISSNAKSSYSVTGTIAIVDVPNTYTISGSIANSSGVGLANVSIRAYTDKSSVSDSVGNYTISGVVPGTYYIYPTASGVTFTPTFLTVTVSNSNLIGQNFTSA